VARLPILSLVALASRTCGTAGVRPQWAGRATARRKSVKRNNFRNPWSEVVFRL